MVYVDWLMKHGWKMWGKTVESCHMMADSLAELHLTAKEIGLKRCYFQHKRGCLPHYDLVASKRILAIAAGAHELTKKEYLKTYPRLLKKFNQ